MVTSLYLMPTTRCNLACEYCYCPEDAVRGDADLFRRITHSFTEHVLNSSFTERPQIRFTGGEPWLEEILLPDLTEHFLNRVPEGWVVVNTNATLLPADRLRDFRGNESLIHVVSLDGPPAHHDSRRKTADGQGTFNEVVSGVKMLLDLDLPVYLNAVLDEESFFYLPELIRFITEELGLRELSLSLLHSDEDRMSVDTRFDLLENAYSAASSSSIRLGGHHRLLLGPWIPELSCNAGGSTALVDPCGMVHACQRFLGRSKPDCMWSEDFDWRDFYSGQQCGPVCGNDDDHQVGQKLYTLYRKEYPEYLAIHQLDRILFGVI